MNTQGGRGEPGRGKRLGGQGKEERRGLSGQARCWCVPGASLTRNRGCWFSGGPARSRPAPLTVVMHGRPNEAAVDFDRGLIG